jgi:molybdenum cofactor cytidylyltransferase
MKTNQQSIDSIAAIIIAAGASSRFGSPKQLLIWEKDNLLNTLIKTTSDAGLNPIMVVLGCHAIKIEQSILDKSVKVIFNQDWEKGQSTSVKAGVQALVEAYPNVLGAFFLPVDQPQTPVELLQKIKEKAYKDAQIVLPLIRGQKSSPVYFSKRCFDKLRQITGDQGGRAIMPHFEVETVEWADERQHLDIDRPEDYIRLRQLYGIHE